MCAMPYLEVAPVASVRRRLATLLAEWPDHPLLGQLAEICDRVMALPLLGPLKSVGPGSYCSARRLTRAWLVSWLMTIFLSTQKLY